MISNLDYQTDSEELALKFLQELAFNAIETTLKTNWQLIFIQKTILKLTFNTQIIMKNMVISDLILFQSIHQKT